MYNSRRMDMTVPFSISYAMAICNGQEPEGLQFDTTVMRRHLYDCLEDQQMKHFPSKVRKYAKIIKREEKVQVFAIAYY